MSYWEYKLALKLWAYGFLFSHLYVILMRALMLKCQTARCPVSSTFKRTFISIRTGRNSEMNAQPSIALWHWHVCAQFKPNQKEKWNNYVWQVCNAISSENWRSKANKWAYCSRIICNGVFVIELKGVRCPCFYNRPFIKRHCFKSQV